LDAADFADPDLKCAAKFMTQHVMQLDVQRDLLWKPVKALAERLRPLTQWLVARQPPTVRVVAGTLHVAFIAVMVVLSHWPDTTLPLRYLEGFSQVGVLEFTGALRDLRLGFYSRPPVSEAEVMSRAEDDFRV
jgi:hypothetical protein